MSRADGMMRAGAERIAIRPAAPEDAPACARILQGWLDATPWMPDLHGLEETEWFVRERLMIGTMLVAGEVEGFLALDGEAIPALHVAAGSRGRGTGSALLGAAQNRSARLRLWTFRANHGARRFYLRHGFAEGRTTPGDNHEGLPDVEMTWERGA